ncbi:cob(I)yrinic acid a,c-diamide adenosyltransferase [Telmatospirillum sp.]|uniref:cob(I)yrinic acid a,c-diamide adenosyltransferase n=1 Tax=Telmatospirillum sp. TaxID=2079197 RepID=UPI00284AC803|nr:cob(I)yrinic acid a,c-diamide adenosyltransferase [Telmatospirillum sp.]MDR3435878.1 cob(I)yrinic acid a,c-diamide adenosyltransferase [Telmatospirillum sp.]
MVQLTRIYTRGGDKGKTSLGDGRRVAKHNLRVEAYGSVDEANAVIGLVRQHTADSASADAMLARIQNDLFDLGADLCIPEAPEEQGGLRIIQTQIDRLEHEIDAMNAQLPPLASFVLPGGTAAAAQLHFGRTVVRRAERLICQLAEVEPVNPLAVAYINRLSDHLFVLARHLNKDGDKDILWVPGATRQSVTV